MDLNNLITQVQARINNLTGSETLKELMALSIACDGLEVDRTLLDQAINNMLSGLSSENTFVELMAANRSSVFGEGEPPLGSLVVNALSGFGDKSPVMIREKNSNYLRHGYYTFDKSLFSDYFLDKTLGLSLVQQDSSGVETAPFPSVLIKIANRFKTLGSDIYTASGSTVYKSADKGFTWQSVYTFSETIRYFYVVQPDANINPGSLIVAGSGASGGAFAISHDEAVTWSTGVWGRYLSSYTRKGLFVDELTGNAFSLDQRDDILKAFITKLNTSMVSALGSVEVSTPAASLGETSSSNNSSFIATACGGCFLLAFDVGGSSVECAAVDYETMELVSASYSNRRLNTPRSYFGLEPLYSETTSELIGNRVFLGPLSSTSNNSSHSMFQVTYMPSETPVMQTDLIAGTVDLVVSPNPIEVSGGVLCFKNSGSTLSSVDGELQYLDTEGGRLLLSEAQTLNPTHGAVLDPDDSSKIICFSAGLREVFELAPGVGTSISLSNYPFFNTYMRVK